MEDDAERPVSLLKRSFASVAVTIFEDTVSELPAPPLAPELPMPKLLERTSGSIGSQDVAELGVKAAHMRGGMNIIFEASIELNYYHWPKRHRFWLRRATQ